MRPSVFTVTGLACMAFASAASAQAVIGDAARAVNDVTGAMGGKRVAIVSGSAVHQNETVSTGPSAMANLRFLDDTSLEVSPGSRVQLDRYVFNRDGSARGAVVSMTRGAFRFTTGQSDPAAFRLQTPQAVIGIRGTVLDIEVEGGMTHVTLLRGAISVCARARRNDCTVLTRPGSTVSVSRAGLSDDDRAIPPVVPQPQPPSGPGFWQPGFPGGSFGGGGRPGRPNGGGGTGPGRGNRG